MVLIAIYLFHALKRGPIAGPDPWGSRSFEWRALSPPSPHNFDGTPEFSPGTYDYHLPRRPPDV
jgi:cytochrome c oxidase subunit 1